MKILNERGKITIRKQEWAYGYGDAGVTNGQPNDGICEYDVCRIIIRRRGRSRSLLNVVAHEVAHAFFPSAREGQIERFSRAFEQIYSDFSKPAKRAG